MLSFKLAFSPSIVGISNISFLSGKLQVVLRKAYNEKESMGTSLVAQTVKRLPTMQEIQVQSLGQEDLPEKEMAIHSSILAWKIPWMEEPGRLQSMGLLRIGHN